MAKRRINFAAAIATALLWFGSPAEAQTISPAGATVTSTGASASVQLPANTTKYPALLITPALNNLVAPTYALGTPSVAASAANPVLPNGGICVPNVGPGAYLAIYTGSGTATVNLTQAATCPSFSGLNPNGSSGGGAVSSVFGRTGAVVATTGDYSFGLLSGQASLAQLPTLGANTVLGSIAGGTPIAMTKTQLTSLINVATASLPGAVPAWPNDATKFFNGQGNYITAITSITFGNGTSALTCTTTCAVSVVELTNAQTGAGYTVVTGDWGKLISVSNASAETLTVPQAGSAGFAAGFFFDVFNSGAGTWTITPTTSTINGASTFSLTTNTGIRVVSDGTNYRVAGTVASGGAVSSVSNSDSTLTISPTTGVVVASLNLGNANTWTAIQSFNSGDLALKGASSGVTTLNANATSGTVTAALPANTGIIAELNFAQTWSAVQTFNANDLLLAGVTGSTQCLQASSTGVVTGTGSACGSGSGAVNSVTNSDGTLTISPTTGSVVASLALGNANTWTAVQTFTNSDVRLLGSSTGYSVFMSANSGASNFTITFPAATANIDYQVGSFTNGHCLQASGTAGGIADSGSACGGGSSTITANSTATSGFSAGQVLYSDGSLVQAAGITGTLGSVVLSVSPTLTGAITYGAGAAILTSPAAATMQLGAADAASPVAQKLFFQNVVAGTANTAGAAETIQASLSTGTAAPGLVSFTSGFTGTTQSGTTVTISVASPAVVTLASHGLVPGSSFQFATTGALPTGISAATTYYVIATALASGTFEFSATPGGAAINSTGTQSGTQSITTNTTTQNPASTVLSVGPYALTGSQTTAGVSVNQVWNTSGVADAALLVKVTNIASGANSIIADFQIGAVSPLKVVQNGLIIPSGNYIGTSSQNQIVMTSATSLSVQWNNTGPQWQMTVSNTSISAAANYSLAWSTTSNNAAATLDTTMCRQAAGVVEIGASASCAASGSLLLTGLTASGNIVANGAASVITPKGYTVSTLPASPATGSVAYVTDAVACTFLAALTGGSSTYCPVTYNGAAWVGG